MASQLPRVMVLMAALTVALAGCTTASTSTRALSLLPGGDDAPPAETGVLAALNGGIIGPVVGDQLTRDDRRRALQAEYQALETVPVGRSISWSGERSGLTGEVKAAQAYQVGSQNCRQYTHTVRGGTQPIVARGTACRDSAGAWTPLT